MLCAGPGKFESPAGCFECNLDYAKGSWIEKSLADVNSECALQHLSSLYLWHFIRARGRVDEKRLRVIHRSQPLIGCFKKFLWWKI